MTAAEIKKVMMIGSGTMAQQIAGQCALYGHEVVLYVRDEEELQIAKNGILKSVLAPIVNTGAITQEAANKIAAEISYINDPSQTPRDVDLVSESVLESYEIKEKVWRDFAPHLPEHAILTTNTSSLQPSRFADACGAPQRFLAWHFCLPVFFQNIADVMPLPKTDKKYVSVMVEFSRKIHENAIVLKKETEGYLANSMLFAVLNEALSLYRREAADIENIDKAWMGARLAEIGPFGIIDKIGTDLSAEIIGNWDGVDLKNIEILKEMASKGLLGIKSKKGFYTYPNPVFQKQGFIFRNVSADK